MKTRRFARFILCVVLGLIMVLSAGTRVLAHQGPGKGTVSEVGWRGEYWANSNLGGEPALVRNDRAIDFDWGYDAPVPELPADRFSVRWTRVAVLEEGLYRFRAVVDDGIRLYVDGDPVIDEWRNGSRREMTQDRWLAAGQHALRVEYYEDGGEAVARVRWDKVTLTSVWKGEYWPNIDIDGQPAMVRNDPDVAFDWKQASPGPRIPENGFSARWTRTVAFEPGSYRFRVLSDDGMRLWVDGQLLIDKWQDQHPRQFVAERTMTGGMHDVKVEYYENTGRARIQVWWEKAASSQ